MHIPIGVARPGHSEFAFGSGYRNMKLLSFAQGGKSYFGALKDGAVVNLAMRMPAYSSLRELLADGAMPQLRTLLDSSATDYNLDEIEFLPTIPDAERIVCVGVNYANRNEEYKDASEAPRYPSLFMRTRESLVGHMRPILRPRESEQLDYEGEIAIVIGKAGRRIPRQRAREHIAGLTLMNEGTIRDYVRHGKFNVTQGKNFEATGALGPTLVTADEFEDFASIDIRTQVNGELRQHNTTANLMFPFEHLISYISSFMRLKPGDIISTGTPTGAGARFDPPRYLKPGDLVEISSSKLGVLSNPVKDEDTHTA